MHVTKDASETTVLLRAKNNTSQIYLPSYRAGILFPPSMNGRNAEAFAIKIAIRMVGIFPIV